MKSIVKLLFGLLLTLGGSSWAGGSLGLVTSVFVHEPNMLMFKAGAISGTPACNVDGVSWAISMDKPDGKALLAVLLSAQSQGKEVYVRGYTNTCADWADRELPSFVELLG